MAIKNLPEGSLNDFAFSVIQIALKTRFVDTIASQKKLEAYVKKNNLSAEKISQLIVLILGSYSYDPELGDLDITVFREIVDDSGVIRHFEAK